MLRHLAALAAAIFTFGFVSASAEEAAKPIREFDIATIEALGRHIYKQDQEAWKASDVLMAVVKSGDVKPGNARGWIVTEAPGRDVVRFVRVGANGPESFYDVAFDSDIPLEMGPPKDSKLSEVEIAQWNARMLALSKFDFRCTDATPNTVAFRDGANWLVWVMTATRDPSEVILAGHTRFTVSADGKSIIQGDRLSKGCVVNKPEKPPEGYQPVASAVTSFVSRKPLETQVFTNLNYKTPFYVDTLDGVTWKIDGGRISTVEMDAPKPDGDIARRLGASREKCLTLYQNTGEGNHDTSVGPEARVMAETEQETFRVAAPSGKRVSAFLCFRGSLVPALYDWKVLRTGASLYIEDGGIGHPKRTVVLYVLAQDRKVHWRLDEGEPLTPELQAAIERRVAAFQKEIDKP